jgi:hypothetical protein
MRQEPVYRRRRAVALLLLVLVVAAIVLVVKALATPSGSSSAKTPAPTTSTTPSVTPTATTACDAKDLDLAVATDHTAFALGAKVPFVVTVTYHGEQPCLVDASDVSRAVVVTSGKDRIWSSADCAEQDERSLLLAKGDVDRKTVPWPMVRSAEGCAKGLPDVRPGTYKVRVTLGDAKSDALVFTIG